MIHLHKKHESTTSLTKKRGSQVSLDSDRISLPLPLSQKVTPRVKYDQISNKIP